MTDRDADVDFAFGALGMLFAATFGLLFAAPVIDRPAHVREYGAPTGFAAFVAWLSVAAHLVGSWFFTQGVTLFAAPWMFFAGWMLARRLAARAGIPVGIRDLNQALAGSIVDGRGILAVCAVGPTLSLIPGVQGSAFGLWIARVAWIATIAMFGWAGRDAVRIVSIGIRGREWARGLLAQLFGLSTADTEALWPSPNGNGGLVVHQVPVKMADVLATQGIASINERLAGLDPELMVAAWSNHDLVEIVPVDADEASRRVALTESGGAIAGVADATPQTVPGELVITEDDLR